MKTTVNEPMPKAGNYLNWPPSFGDDGIAILKKIVDMAIRTESMLLVHLSMSDNKCIDEELHISHEQLKNYIKNNNCDLIYDQNQNYVIPRNLFSLP